MKDLTTDIVSIAVLAAVLVLNILLRNQFHGLFFAVIGASMAILDMAIWIIGKMTLGEYFTTSVHPKGLVTKGIYAKITHPMYYGGIIIYIGVGLFLKSLVGLALTVAVIVPMLLYFARKENSLLHEKYKEKYSAYKTKTVI